MNPDKLTQAVTEALNGAQQIAQTRHHQDIDIPHLWRTLVQPNELTAQIYTESGINLPQLNHVIDAELDKISVVEGVANWGQNMGRNLYQLFQDADKVRAELQDQFIATDTLVLASCASSTTPSPNF